MSDRWGEYRNFAAKYFSPLGPDDGVSPEEVAAAEARLGFRLPEAVREFYLLAGKREDLTARSDFLTALEDLTLKDGLLTIWEENQGISAFVIEQAQLAERDPVMQFRVDGELSDDDRVDRFTDVCLLEAALQLVNEGDFTARVGGYGYAESVYGTADWFIENYKTLGYPPPQEILAYYGFVCIAESLVYCAGNEIIIAAQDATRLKQTMALWPGIKWNRGSIALEEDE